MLTSTESKVQDYIEKFRVDFLSASWYDIASPRSIGDFEKYDDGTGFKKGALAHIKGAIMYNRCSEPYRGKYRKIINGDKIKFLFLKTENPFGVNCIAFIDDLPQEFNMDDYIDKNLQFNKVFIEPVKSLLDIVKWKTDKGNYNIFSFTL
jgi:hypothetical protein